MRKLRTGIFVELFALATLAACASSSNNPSTTTNSTAGGGNANVSGAPGLGGLSGVAGQPRGGSDSGGQSGGDSGSAAAAGSGTTMGGSSGGSGGAVNVAGAGTASGGDTTVQNGGGGGLTGCSGAVFCDGFEGNPTLKSDWTVDNSVPANTIEVVTNMAHTGTNSVHIKYGTAATASYIDESKGFPFAGNSYWGRVWMYAMTGLEAGHHVWIEARTGAAGTGVRALNTQHNGQLATNLESSDGGGISTLTLPQGKWTCFEWQIASMGGSTATGAVHLYMDGTEVPGVAQTNWVIPSMTKQRIGIQRYGGGTAGELWYDDYAVGAARLGCN
jgi:hypothetical protein